MKNFFSFFLHITYVRRAEASKKLKTGVVSEPVLVGRERELKDLESFLSSAIEGKGKTVFISGEAGAGKTRLVNEFFKIARSRGVAILKGWCLSDAETPYFPFVEAFNSYFGPTDKERSVPFSPELRFSSIGPSHIRVEDRGIAAWLTQTRPNAAYGNPRDFSPEVWKDQVFVGVAQALHSIAAQQPIIFFIEDIHWADSASLALLHYLSRFTCGSEQILLLATFRSGELTADLEGHPHHLAETLRLMNREDLFIEIALSGLTLREVSELVENMMGGNIQPELAERLSQESRGNALFVVETLRMLLERKGLVQQNGQWRLAIDDLGIPSKIRDIILRRLGVLKFPQRRVLDAASVIGEKFDVNLLSTVLGIDGLETLETLNAIARTTLLVNAEGDFYRFDHARSRETLYEELSSPLKRGYHARIAEKLESSTKEGRMPYSELTYHFARGGNTEKAVKYAEAAGQDALSRYSNEEAIKHFIFVLQAAKESLQYASNAESALEGLGDAYFAKNTFAEAIRTYEQLAGTTSNNTSRLRALRKAMNAAYAIGNASHLEELVERAQPYLGADRLENARILINRARVQVEKHRLIPALQFCESALKIFKEEHDLSGIASASIGLGVYHTRLGHAQKGLVHSLLSVALFEELGDTRNQMLACSMAALSFGQCLLDQEMLEMLLKDISIAEKAKLGHHLGIARAYTYSAQVFENTGELEKAISYNLKGLDAIAKTDSVSAKAVLYRNLTIEHALLGNVKDSQTYFEKLLAMPPDIFDFPTVGGSMAKAMYLAAVGLFEESNRAFKDRFKAIKSAPSPREECKGRLLYAWVLEKQGRLEEANAQLEVRKRAYQKAEEMFAHVNIQASLMVRTEIFVGEELELRLDFVNLSRKSGLLSKVEEVIPAANFTVGSVTSWCDLEGSGINLKNRNILPFKVETVKLTLRIAEAGTYALAPQVTYIDDQGESKSFKLNPVAITVKSPGHVLEGRISSGLYELDDLLLGGIPENFSVILASPSCDERDMLVERFLQAGVSAGDVTFYITMEPLNPTILSEEHKSNFFIIMCNPQADVLIQSAPNVFKVKGVENLTNIDIELVEALRASSPLATGPKRLCIEIVSDVLLVHHAVTTRRWLSALLPTLKSKGFTVLGVVDPLMHPSEELRAVLGLFDGEIRVSERETENGPERFLRVWKLHNKKRSGEELILTGRMPHY